MSVAGLVLAAGAGTRFGGPKALARLDGRTLLDHAVTILRDGGCDPVYAVVGAAAEAVRGAATSGFVAVVNPDWAEGLASSLQAGLAALDPRSRAVVVSLVDQPGIVPAAVERVRRAHAAGARVAIAVYNGRRGHPVCFDRALWPGIATSAHGDSGARDFLRANPRLVTEVTCDGLGDPRDIDTAADLERWRRQ